MPDEYKRNGKIIMISPYDDEGEIKMLWLSDRQRQVLLVLSQYLNWKNRLKTMPPDWETDDDIDTWNDKLREMLMLEIAFCEQVINCIENDTDVGDALSQWLQDRLLTDVNLQTSINNVFNQYAGGNKLPVEYIKKNLLPEISGCDRDTLWGSVSRLIDEMHLNNLDAFEAFENITNAAERAQLVMSAIPVAETLPIDEGIEYVETLWTDDLFEAYIANDTTTYRLELKCSLFCFAVLNNCRLSIEFVYDYFIRRLAVSSSDTFAQIVGFLVTGTWSGTEINDVFYLTQIMAMYYTNQYFSIIGLQPFQRYLLLGSRNPSDEWEIVCDDCGYEVVVFANKPVLLDNTLNGTDTLLDVVSGTEYSLSPSGLWNYGAESNVSALGHATINLGAIVPTSGLARLVYKIGKEGTWLATDDTFVFTAGASGRLYLACNDVPGTYNDNSGSITCTIDIIP